MFASQAMAMDVKLGRDASIVYSAQGSGGSASVRSESDVGRSARARSVNVKTRLPSLGDSVRERDKAAPKATTSIERGVRITRGAPSRRAIEAGLERQLDGTSGKEQSITAKSPTVIVKKQKVVIYRQCVKPRRLKFHGPFEGVRVYHRPVGNLAFDSFGFGSNNRFKPRLCGQGRLGVKSS
ncbi:MAG: hypothetical protein AAF720_10300 [Pseudomonadota bacterium]